MARTEEDLWTSSTEAPGTIRSPPRNVPAGRDVVYCGSGTDTVYADHKDVLYGCERVRFENPDL